MFANVPRVEGDLVLAVAGVNDCTVCWDAVGNDLVVTCAGHDAVVCMECLPQILGSDRPNCTVCRSTLPPRVMELRPRVERYIDQLVRQNTNFQIEKTRQEGVIQNLTRQLRERDESRDQVEYTFGVARAQLRNARVAGAAAQAAAAAEAQAQAEAQARAQAQARALRNNNRARRPPAQVDVRNVRQRFAADLEDVWAPGGDDSSQDSSVPDHSDDSDEDDAVAVVPP